MRARYSCFALVLIWLIGGTSVGLAMSLPRIPEGPTAQQILDRMARTYATCKTYHDTGEVRLVLPIMMFRKVEVRPFTTSFIRPDRFRFEYAVQKGRRLGKNYIVWGKGKEAKTWWDIGLGFLWIKAKPRIEKEDSLDLAIAGATGISGGSAHTIPALLLPEEIIGRKLTKIEEIRRLPDAKLGKVKCYCIYGKFVGVSTTLWIDKKTFLVRQIAESHKAGKLKFEDTTTYQPRINGKVTDKMLEFLPPQVK
jgi:hypothetical protein